MMGYKSPYSLYLVVVLKIAPFVKVSFEIAKYLGFCELSLFAGNLYVYALCLEFFY